MCVCYISLKNYCCCVPLYVMDKPKVKRFAELNTKKREIIYDDEETVYPIYKWLVELLVSNRTAQYIRIKNANKMQKKTREPK